MFRCQALGPELLLHRKAAAVQLGQQAGDGIRSCFQTVPCPGRCIQCTLFPGQLLGQGIQRPARAAVTGRTVGRQIGPAGFGFGVLGGLVFCVQVGQLAAACIQMALPGGILTGIRFGAGQQGRAPVDKGIQDFDMPVSSRSALLGLRSP